MKQKQFQMKRTINLMKINFIVALVICISKINAQTTQSFTSSGTFTVPAGVTTVQVEAWGGGGAGGGTNSSANRGGGGGAGGSFTRNTSVAVTPGASITVTVGAGGVGVAGAAGGAGGTSIFGSATPVSAVGGAGGSLANGTTPYAAGAPVTVGVTLNGGAGSAGNSSAGTSGAGGGGAGNSTAGSNASGTTGGAGGTGSYTGGTGGAGLSLGSSDGNDVTGLAAGGGGARGSGTNFTSRAGGNGANGRVNVTWTCPTYALTATSGASPVCIATASSTITLTGNATNLPVGTYTVTYSRSLPSATGLTATMTVTTAGTGTFTASGLTTTGSSTITVTNLSSGATGGVCSSNISANNTTVITVNAAPAITTQPSSQSICNGNAVTFNVIATGTPTPTYQWRKAGNNITGATNNSYNIPSVAAGDAAAYSVVLTNSCGTTTSNNATLTVNQPPTANAGTALTTCFNSGAVNITAGSSASNQASVIWTSSGTGTFANATSLTTCTYTPSAADISAGSVTLTLTANPLTGCSSVSDTKTLTITSLPATVGAITGSATVCANGNLTYSVNPVSGATSYTWTVPSGWTISSGQGTSSIDVIAGNGGQNGNITVIANNNCGSNNNPSSPVMTANINPVNATNNTGYCTSSLKTSGDIQCNSNTLRGYAKFLLSSINTPGATVTAATLSVVNNNSTTVSTATNDLRGLANNDPVTTSASSLYSIIGSGTIYNSSVWSNTGTVSLSLNSAGISDIQSRLTSPGYLALGFDRGGTATYIFHGMTGGANAPLLSVSYTVPRYLSVTVNAQATAIAGSNFSTCSNSGAVNITSGSSASNYSTITWTSSGSGTFTNANSLTLATYNPSAADIAAGSVVLTLTANGNSPCSNAISTKTLTILPVATSDAGTAQTICHNSSAALSGSIGNGATAALWSTSGDGTFDNTASLNASYTPGNNDKANGTVVLTLTASGAGVCSATSSLNLTVLSGVPAQPDAIAGAPANVCPPTAAFTLSSNSATAVSYNWYTGPGTNGVTFLSANGSNTMNVQFGATSNSTYSIRVEATNACGTGPFRSVLVRRATSVPAAVAGTTTACPNTSNTYTATLVDGATEYVWSITGNATVTGNTNSVTVNFASNWNGGTLCVASKVGCFTSATKCISIGTSASALNTVGGMSFTACPNTSLNFNVIPSTGVASYNWTVPANATITQGAGTNAITVAFGANYNNTGNICVTATSICGVVSPAKCKSVAPGLPAVPASITGGTNGLCNVSSAFTTPSQNGVTAYNWTAPGTITGNGNNNVSVLFGNLTTGQVCVTATNNCGTSAPRCVSVKGAPNTPASLTAYPGTWCPNTDGIEFDANTSNISGSYTLNWAYPTASANYVLGGGNSSSLLLDWTTGNGNVMVTASNACGSGTKVFNVVLENCRQEGISASQNFEIYPNPAADILNVSFASIQSENVKLKLSDYSGKTIINETWSSHSGINQYQLNVSKLAPGVYILDLNTAQGNLQKKIVKQ
jgi:hypothetical protein